MGQPRRIEEPAYPVRLHDERLPARLGGQADTVRVTARVRRLGGREVGRVVPGPPAPIPPDPLLALTPGTAPQVGRGPVVHDPAVCGPGPSPIEMRARLSRRVRLLPGREVSIGCREHAAVDPGCTGG